MGKGGRKRKAGARYPSGKLKQPTKGATSISTKPAVEPMSGALWQRLVQHGRQLGLDERLTTELGRLNRFGELTVAQTVAGFRVAEIYGRFESINQLPRSARSPSYNASYGESGIAEELLSHEALMHREEMARAALESFKKLQDEMKLLPRDLHTAIEDLCVEDRAVNSGHYEGIRRFLTRMSVIWRVTNAARAPGAGARAVARLPRPVDAVSAPGAFVTAPARPRFNVERSAFLRMLSAVRPDLDGGQLEASYAYYVALKDRTAARAKKAARGAPVRADSPPPAVESAGLPIDRPKLGLPDAE